MAGKAWRVHVVMDRAHGVWSPQPCDLLLPARPYFTEDFLYTSPFALHWGVSIYIEPAKHWRSLNPVGSQRDGVLGEKMPTEDVCGSGFSLLCLNSAWHPHFRGPVGWRAREGDGVIEEPRTSKLTATEQSLITPKKRRKSAIRT